MVPLLTGERVAIGVGGLLFLLLIERLRPFRPAVDSLWRRYGINFLIAGSNALVLSVLLSGVIVGAYRVLELHRYGLLHVLGIESWANVLLTVVFLDGVTYGWHRAYHGVGVMWRMHRVHHSDRDLDVTTASRFHLSEMALSAVFRLAVIAAWGANVASIIIFEIVFGLLNQIEHSNLSLPRPLDTLLRYVFVTPSMHAVHHSRELEHTNANYGTLFSWWDRLFGTYRVVPDREGLTMGLPEYPRSEDVTVGKVFAMPFGPPCEVGHGSQSA